MQESDNRYTKLSRKLLRKKGRQEEQRFLLCGRKSINEALKAKADLFHIYIEESSSFNPITKASISYLSTKELSKLSPLEVLQDAMAICSIPKLSPLKLDVHSVVCDGVSDPGNMGTIIRLCDWFGIKQLVLSDHSVDVYNPKCVQASMGSIFRVDVHYTSLGAFYKAYQGDILLSTLDGTSMTDFKQGQQPFALVLGSESHGLNHYPIVDNVRHISIPRFGKAESLNVANAAAILLSHLTIN